jgi:hypothetical protein
MKNGNTEVIREMRKLIEQGKPLDIDTRDRLLFTAVIDIYERLDELGPALTFYRVGLFFASAIGVAILGFIGALLTGKVELIFK